MSKDLLELSIVVGYVLIICLLMHIYAINRKYKKNEAFSGLMARERAQKLTKTLWRACGEPRALDSSSIIVIMTHYSWENIRYPLLVEHEHPDFQRFQGLKDGNIIELDFLEEIGKTGALHEPASYLRIKYIS